jgi:GrpB-like predicted nucleotidyltransferase (UPF0157 family)
VAYDQYLGMNRIEIKPYNKDWPNQFEAEALKTKGALAFNCFSIYHIGSTSVPNLPAKEKIDIYCRVKGY